MRFLLLLLLTCLTWNCSNTPETNDNTAAAPEAVPVADTSFTPIYPLSYVMGQFDPAEHPDFVPIETQYADRGGLYLHRDTYAAFLKMHAAAAQDDVNLLIRSATRNFQSQKGIWEAKWNGSRKIENGKDASVAYPDPKTRALKILEYSSMPSTSRHHWGTDIDLNNFTNEWFESGEGLKIYTWLQENAADYGFCQPYTEKGPARPNGYNEERWHWSYLPLAKPLTKQARRQLSNDMIEGFLGAEVAEDINVVQNYVLGINEGCLP